MDLAKLKQIRDQFQFLGQNPSYDNFIFFVKREIAPYMEMKFIEEPKLKEIYNQIWSNQFSGQQIHRGFGKSELGIWINIFLICCKPINPFSGKHMTEGLLITSADDALRTLSARIKHYFYENPKLRIFLPFEVKKITDEKKNTFWSNAELYFNNGVILHLRTIMSKSIRGNHVDWIWGDDLVGDNSQIVDKKIEEVWFYAVDGCTTAKDALTFVTGTPRRATDIMEKMNESVGYFFKKYPIFDGDKLISKRWTMDRAKKVKTRIGSVIWQCEYMLDPIDDSTSLIKREWLNRCQLTQFDINRERPKWASAVYLGVDFAFSDRITADKSAFVIIAEFIKKERRYFIILDIITRKGMSGLEQMDYIKELNETYQFDLIGLEENSIKAISKHIKEYNLPIKRFWTGTHDEKEEVEEGAYKEFTTVSKRNLIIRLGTSFENREIIIPYKSEEAKDKASALTNECISFAQEQGKIVEIGIHPDIPIALAYAKEVATRWGNDFMI